MKDPRDCVPKGTVPLMFDGDPRWLGKIHVFNECSPREDSCRFYQCAHIGFRVPPEMMEGFKY